MKEATRRPSRKYVVQADEGEPVINTTVKRHCLRCGTEFLAPTRYIRLCPTCTRFIQAANLDEQWMLME